MGTKQKLLDRLKSLPKDFTFDEAVSVLKTFGYTLRNKGTTSGSRVSFSAPGRAPIMLHKPHPKKIMKQYAIKQLLEILTSNGDISE
ncbi:MAG: type II toxin-antitoxin system HicA family toxin [Bacteroidales bacterium]|jgi:hypothetical protein|nr:type II toxin-antitoxin system HicA family toxin [Bacteroidales bacterium]